MSETMDSIPEEYRKLPQETDERVVEKKEVAREYNPLEPLRRDFNSERIFRNERGEAVIDDPDLHQIMQFYRDSVKDGSLLDLGAGATHEHYMAAIEDKLSRITALDLSPKNIQLLRELQEGVAGRATSPPEFIEKQDIETLKLTTEAIARDPRYGEGRTAEGILDNIVKKTTREDGRPDLIIGDMYDLKNLEGRKFDNVLIGFALFVLKDEKDLERLFSGIREHLAEGGNLIISDFEGFTDEDLEEFSEDAPVLSRYHTNYPLNPEVLENALRTAGFSKTQALRASVQTEGIEKEHDLQYLFARASHETAPEKS